MKTPTENLDIISEGLNKGESESYAANAEWGLHKCDSDIIDAQVALTELRQQVADLQAFYEYMTDGKSTDDERRRLIAIEIMERINLGEQTVGGFADLLRRIKRSQEPPADDESTGENTR